MSSQRTLPVDAILPELKIALNRGSSAVLVAPPGAGKTTRVPLAILEEPWLAGRKVLVLEPRRIAARAAASHMARLARRTAGRDRGLAGAACHHGRADDTHRGRDGGRVHTPHSRRSDPRRYWRDPVRRISRALAGRRHRACFGARCARGPAPGPAYPRHVGDTRCGSSGRPVGRRACHPLGRARISSDHGYLGRDARRRIEDEVADAVVHVPCARGRARSSAFLPGQSEVRRVAALLTEESDSDRMSTSSSCMAASTSARSNRPLRPLRRGGARSCSPRRLPKPRSPSRACASSSIAGLQRVPRYEPDVGITRLDTVRVSRASADQRRGRAGRTEPGVCYRCGRNPRPPACFPS